MKKSIMIIVASIIAVTVLFLIVNREEAGNEVLNEINFTEKDLTGQEWDVYYTLCTTVRHSENTEMVCLTESHFLVKFQQEEGKYLKALFYPEKSEIDGEEINTIGLSDYFEASFSDGTVSIIVDSTNDYIGIDMPFEVKFKPYVEHERICGKFSDTFTFDEKSETYNVSFDFVGK